MLHSRLFFLLAFFTLTSCAELQQRWAEQSCSHEAAYAQGVNDARDGKRMDSSYATLCPVKSRERVRAGYREGYTAGLASLQGTTPNTVISVNVGGTSSSRLSDHSWHCEVEAFTDKYEAFGRTRLEARNDAVRQCTVHYHPMHCDEVECQPNR